MINLREIRQVLDQHEMDMYFLLTSMKIMSPEMYNKLLKLLETIDERVYKLRK